MELKKLEVTGLFHKHDYRVEFPEPSEGRPQPSLVILHGPNGVGKTTLLRMLDGMIRLDFNVFREVPFHACSLHLSTSQSLHVRPAQEGKRSLEVEFDSLRATLHPKHPGPLDDAGREDVEAFRQGFFKATEALTFDFIDSSRIITRGFPQEEDYGRVTADPSYRNAFEALNHQLVWHSASLSDRVRRGPNPKARSAAGATNLAGRVAKFIREAQVNYRTFFASKEPDLFQRIVLSLTTNNVLHPRAGDLLSRLKTIKARDEHAARFGLEADRWDFEQLAFFLAEATKRTDRDNALAVIGAYVDVLESRSAERALVAERLLRFEGIMSDFIVDKRVLANAKEGLIIETSSGDGLREDQLSSGEYHLLYLMVATLVTKQRGTVIAIDEPEMSMHLAWQRKLVRALFDCASSAEPQFLLATHSPDIAADYPDALVELGFSSHSEPVC